MMKWNKKKLSRILFISIGIIVAFVIIPICVNLLLGSTFNPTPFELNGTTGDWHNFWAVYLGALIGATVPFVILYMTLSNNRIENESNRNLQLKIFKYQQEQLWLDKFREASAQYLLLYSYNDLIEVANVARRDPNRAFYMIKDLFARAGKADLELAFFHRYSKSFNKIDEDKTKLFIYYNDILGDIQSILTIRIEDEQKTLKDGYATLDDLTDDMRTIISRIFEEMPDADIEDQFNTAIMTRIQLIKHCEEKLRDWFSDYIYAEQMRIDGILIEQNGTEQNK